MTTPKIFPPTAACILWHCTSANRLIGRPSAYGYPPLHVHGKAVLRIKGILNIGENYPVLINGVQHMIYPPQHLNEWPNGTHDSQLVLITAGLDTEKIAASFRRQVLLRDQEDSV